MFYRVSRFVKLFENKHDKNVPVCYYRKGSKRNGIEWRKDYELSPFLDMDLKIRFNYNGSYYSPQFRLKNNRMNNYRSRKYR